MKKRLLSLLLIFCMTLSILPMEVLALNIQSMTGEEKLALLENPFTDVLEKDWFFDAVQYVRINSIFNGVSATAFDPNGTLTRGMFVTVLGRMAGVDKENYEGQSVFDDVAPDQYYAPYVAWAYSHGITTGTGEGTFSPNAPVSRQQMATFFMRYFEKFGVDYHTGVEVTTTPADLHLVADYAKASVVMMWQVGLLNGDGVSFNPASNATRAETATLCMRTDKSVDTWYKEPGVPSERIAIDPKDIKVRVNSMETVYFFNDKMECFDEITTWTGSPLSHLPPVEKSSRPGKVLVGYYLDPEFKEPFYAENPVTTDLMVYAKYQDMDDQTRLNLTTFTQMDQPADLTFEIERVSGTTSAANAAELIVKDGSLPVDIQVRANSKGTYTVSPVGEYNKGSTYELTLAEGWNFVGKADTIRTASFSIHMDEVNNLRMGDNILYVEDTTGALSEEIASVLERGADANATGSFTLPASAPTGIKAGDILCVYVGVHPLDRAELANDDDADNDKALMDPANYIKVKSITSDKVTSIDGRKVTFGALEAEDQIDLYEIPDLFPFYVDSLPTSGGSVNIRDFDLSFYETAYGKVEGTLAKARTKVSDGDFVAFYTSLEDGEDSEVFYGRVTGYNEDTGVITYAASSEEELLNCMDLYSVIDYGGEVLISDAQAADLEARLLEQVEESGFAEEAAYMVADLITKTDNFNENKKLRTLLLTDEEGNSLTPEDIQLMNVGGSFELSDDIQLTVELIRSGKQLHFGNGVQLAIGLDAGFEIEAEDGKVAIDLSATFVQEVELKPAVRAKLTYIQGLPIPIPNGVQVNADIDIKSYTGLSFAAEIFTVAEEDNGLWGQMQEMINDPTAITSFPGLPAELVKGVETVADLLDKVTEMENVLEQSRRDMYHWTLEEAEAEIDAVWNVLEQNGVSRSTWESVGDALGKTSITSDLMGFMDIGTETGLSVEYYDTLEQLLTKYSEMVTKETDWIELVRENIATPQANIAGLCIGVSVDFVVRADMSIALGTNLEYQIGKRYSFWFRIGLYTPTADSSTTDLIDEKFAFQFYVMGKLGVKAGIDATFFVGIGSKDVASVGISAELGPYVKLWGFFIYDYSKYRPKGTETWESKEQMTGALFMEFGLYFMLSFEAEALNLFEYSYDFLDEEIPLLEAGQNRYYYDMNYKPDKDEVVVIRDENGDSRDGITMDLPDAARALSYVDLKSGRMGSEALDYSKYQLQLTSPYFSITDDGKVSVDVPQDVRYLECELTITYLQGKMAFSTYDMSVTIPMIWTNLGLSELKEFYTVSVEVGDGQHDETVWSQKVLKRQPFELPSEAEILEMIGWNDLKYKMPRNGGYGSLDTSNLTAIDNTAYPFRIEYQEYEITVEGIQNKNGSTRTETFTAKYGEAFDFSSLRSTGTAIAGEEYTRFSHVTLTLDGEEIDIRQDIDLHLAQALKDGRVEAQAHYIDDSVTAVFTFVGVTEPDVIIKLRKGDTPSTREVVDVLRAHDESRENDMENSPLYDEETVVISEITPEIGNLMHTTNFMVNCITAGGKRNLVHFDMGEGYYEGYYTDPETGAVSTEIEPWDKLVGSLLVNLPTEEDMSRRGYTFDGWYTKPKAEDDLYHQTGENALTQTVPEKQSVVILEPEKPSTDKPAPDNALTEGAGGTVQKPGASGLKPGDSVIVQNPEPDKIAQDVNHDYTIYAQWTPLTFEVEFDLNGGKSLVYGNKVEDPGLIAPAAPSISGRAVQGTPAGEMTSAFGTAFGDSYVHTTEDCNDDNRYNLKDMEGVDPYGALPSAVYGDSTVPNPDYKNDGNHNKTVHVAFEGWYCDFDGDGDPFEEDELVRDYTVFTRFSDEQLAARKLVLVARWRSMIDIPRNVYTVRTTTNTYDGNSHEPVITFNGGEGHYYYLDKMVGNKAPDESEWLSKAYPEAEGKYPFDGDGYTIDYKRQGNAEEYVRRSTGAFTAGVYDTRIERPMDQAPDQWYDKMSWYYSKNNEVFEIKKADCTIEGSLTAEADGRAVFVDVSLSSAPTDGAGGVQYKVDGGSWGGSEKLYNLSAGSHKIYVRLAEGMNYKASNSIGPVSVTTSASESSGGGFSYKLVIHTPKEGNGGTDADIYAFIGDYGFALDNEGDDFEQGSTGVYDIPGDALGDDISSPLEVTIGLAKSGSSWHWKPGWIRVDVYKGSECIGEGEQVEMTDEYDEDGEEHSYSLPNSKLGRGVDEDTYGLYRGGSYVSIDDTYITDNYQTNYDPYGYENAPKFVASFGNSIFDQFITRMSLTEYYIDWNGVEKMMDEYRISSLKLNYGIRYSEHSGIYGAPDYMSSYTRSVKLPYEDVEDNR